MGILASGVAVDGLEYSAMVGNNLSQLGVDAGQLDSGLDTLSMSLAWMPTTGEFGRGFGDYAQHEDLATRIGVHYTRSDENRQSQPDTEGIENTQIRTSDGNVIFTPGLFGPNISITDAKYQMSALDAGLKYRGLSVESEFTGAPCPTSAVRARRACRSASSATAGSRSRRRAWWCRRSCRSTSRARDFRRVRRSLGCARRRQLLPVQE